MEAEKKFVSQKWQLYAGGADHSKRWFLYTTGADGKRVRDYAGLGRYTDLAERRQKAEQLLAQRNGGMANSATNGISHMAEQWLQAVQTRSRKTNTDRRYIAANWERWMRSNQVWYNTLTPEIAAVFLRDHHASYVFVAKALTKVAIRKGLLKHNPWDGLKRRYHHTPATVIPTGEVAVALKALQNCPRVWFMCLMQYHTFIRPQEQLRLELTDIRLAERVIIIPGVKAKNGRTQRVVIPEPFAPLLEEYLEEHCQNNTYLFQRAGKMYVNPNTFRNIHQDLLLPLRLPKGVNLYSWKHTGAVAAARAGVPLKQLQMQLRHASLDQVNEYLRQMGVEDMDAVRKGW